MEGGKLVHSHSQPGGMDRTPPGTPKKGGKMLAVRVQMLDDSITMFQVQAKALGRVLFDQVCKQLHLLESDYFGLEYQELGGTKYWLDLEKPLSRQIGLSLVDTLVRFCVKFYTPDPSQLEEEFTRYLFCLQIKRDLAQGLLQCNDNTAALMASYIVQAECGDYVVEDYPDHRYLSTFKFVPNQDQELERRIMENHKKHIGQSPAEADLNLLETARRCELYGIKMHPAKDHEGVPLNLAVAHMGIVVFQNYTKINTFSWAKIRKISFKRKRFLVKLHPEGYGCYKDIVEFFFEGRNECKNFWKKCVENHGFFRCSMVKRVSRQKTRVLSRGSSFRYSGRTQKQVVEFVRENYVKRQTFQRSQSFRHSSSARSSVANVGTSISAHPLLPLGDNAVAGTPASLSCGSMTLTSSPLHAADQHAGGSPSPPLTTSVSPGTSVTSSPQHFYPQETPYRRPGHPHSRLNHPQEHSRHTTSPLQSPTSTATTAAINRSASHSNSNIINNNNINNSNKINNNSNLILDNDLKSSRISLKNSDLMYFNDVYSNLYSSLRNLDYSSENVDIENNAKIENSRLLSNTSSKSNESVKSPVKKSKRSNSRKLQKDDHSWLRSTSCKNLYQQQEDSSNIAENQKSAADPFRYEDTPFKIGFDSPVTRYDDSRRGCYAGAVSKTPSIDRAGDVTADARIYSSSYPGTTSSLSTESVEGEPNFDANDSQDEVVLSHDDVSHDSYELLEKDFDDFDEDRVKRNRKYFSENERARSCSWGSDKGEPYPQLDSRSSDKLYGQDYKKSRENGFRSLERSKSPKHKSEIDFRSLERKSPRNIRSRLDGIRSGDRNCMNDYIRKPRDHYGNEADLRRRSKDMNNKVEGLNGRVFDVDDDFHINYDNDSLYSRIQDVRSQKSTEIFRMDTEEEYLDESRKIDRKRDRREQDDRFHEGLKEETDFGRQLYERKKDDEKEEDLYGNKLERVFSNQFGKYPEFLGHNSDYELLKQERKVSENYEKVCQVGKIAKELERTEKALSESLQIRKAEPEVSKVQKDGGKELVKKPFRVSQFNEYNAKTKAGTVIGFVSPKSSPKAPVERTKSDPYDTTKNSKRNVLMHQKSIDLTPQDSAEINSDYDNDIVKKTSRSEHDIPYILRKRHFMNGTAKDSDVQFKAEHRKTIEIINLDAKEDKSTINSLQSKKLKPALAKKPVLTDEKPNPKLTPKKETRKSEQIPVKSSDKSSNESDFADDLNEPIYAQVVKGKVIEPTVTKDIKGETKKKIPPAPPKRTSSVMKADSKKDQPKPPERTTSLPKPKKIPPEPPKRTTSVQKKSPEQKPEAPKNKPEFPGIVAHRREELFARTRLGLSEGSAFTPVSKQGHVDSPSSQRRAKSLDAPVISVHRLPPVDAFSSKDDTVDENEGDMMKYVRSTDSSKEKTPKTESLVDTTISTESEIDVFLPEDGDIDKNFKETVESQTRLEMNCPDEKVLDPVRSKRLLSKIDSMESEGDMDSSRKTEPLPIPSDRLVNLPDSVRFPSVRQISGQTSEESADGWEQREVKVKRRTPRRSVGREDQDVGFKESVVWDSKDDEPPDDDVWDSDAVFPIKQSQSKPEPEYLKRGSCGQSIDDDNVSTPMKESSPEHWVSVDDLPEAIEREERFLREQEKILREKILNEKLKRELNLDTIEIDRRLESSKEKFKGHSLDTYELTEKKLRERGTNKNCSLDEHILRQSPIKNYLSIASDLDLSEKSSSYENVPKKGKCQTEYIKVVNNVNEIDQFGDNDELEEFVVVLDEGLNDKDERDLLWDDVSFRRSLSKGESLISVPEEFKDVEDEGESETKSPENVPTQTVEIKLNEGETCSRKGLQADRFDDISAEEAERKMQDREDPGRLSPFRDAEERRRFSATEDTGRLSPYDTSSRRGSDDPRRGSASDDAGRLSPYDDSRRGSEDPRRLSTSEDSKHYSVSESVSEETRRRLSSTEETRRKRASLTKQCSVGIDSLSDDMIPGIQECSSSFEQDEKDVFEPVPELIPERKDKVRETEVRKLEIEVSEDTSDTKDSGIEDEKEDIKDTSNHLAPPTSERELSRETEDSMDYGEGDFKDLREAVKEQDISDGLVCDGESALPEEKGDQAPSSFEKTEMSEQDELRFIDDKRGSAPDILVGKGKETTAISVVVVNEGISVLNKIVGKEKSRTLLKAVAGTSSTSTDSETTSEEQRHTLPKMTIKPKPLTPKPDYIHRKLTKAVPNIKMKPPIPEKPTTTSSLVETSQESSQDSDVDRLNEVSLLAQIQSQIARRNLADTGKRLRREVVEMVSRESEGKDRASKAEEKSPEQEKRDSGEDVSSSSSAPPYPKRELSSTWRPFLLESSGSSSLEEGWLPPDDNAHLADEEETSSNSNNQQDDSIHDDIDYPTEIPKAIPEASVSIIERENNNTILSSTPLQNGKTNGDIANRNDVNDAVLFNVSSMKNQSQDSNYIQTNVLSELSMNDQNQKQSSKLNTGDSLIGNNSLDTKLMKNYNNRSTLEDGSTPGSGDTENKRKRFANDRGYFIAKELLSTERTYKKDLDVINVWFREEIAKTEEEMPEDVLSCLFNLIEPLKEAHLRFLTEVEQRLSTWEDRNNPQLKGESQGLGDIILNHFSILPSYMKYLDNHLLILERMDAAFRKNRRFEQLYRDFELQRVCYLPLSSFILKPLQRLIHYHNLLSRLIKHYGPEHADYKDCCLAQAKLTPIVENLQSSLKISENFLQLSELQRDMPGFEGLLQGGREFIRQGCLLKHSKKEFQQRMFFLFSDILVYTNRITIPSLQFKVNGQMPLRGVMVEESEDRTGTNYSFIIYGGNRTLTVAASSQEEKDKWLEDLYEAIQNARERNDGKMLQYLSLKSCSSSDEIMDKIGEDNNSNKDKSSQQRSNTTVHVCWHRNTSTSLKDHLKALESELSGFLLRKFKNSNGWQKLWVVFTNFCLFFYKTYLDDFPLASLPLLGYTVSVPSESDDIHKDFVFKLQFKNHVYFFRAESGYTFSRWMEVISSATQHSSRSRLYNRKDSIQ